MSKFNDSSEFSQTIGDAYPQLQRTGSNAATQPEPDGLPLSAIEALPLFPSEVYHGLPWLLAEMVKPHKLARTRDVVLLAGLAAASGLASKVKSQYDGNLISPNIMVMACAVAAAGKGPAGAAARIFREYHERQYELSKAAKRDWEARKKASEAQAKKKNGPPVAPFTEPEPAEKKVYLPVNNSAAQFTKSVNGNGGGGISTTTEIDTMVSTSKQEWGNFSHIHRCAFHNEPVEQDRAGSGYVYIPRPSYSVFFTGTFGPLFEVFKDAENGYFSRNLFYFFEGEQGYRSGRPDPHRKGFAAQYQEMQGAAYAIAEQLEGYDFELQANNEAWDTLDVFGKKACDHIQNLFGNDDGAEGTWKRLILSAFKIAQTLTLLKYKPDPFDLPAIEKDEMQRACMIAETCMHHSALAYENLPKQAAVRKLMAAGGRTADAWSKTLATLPEDFTTAQAVAAGTGNGLSPKTTQRRLKDLTGVTQTGHGRYTKR